MVGVATYGYPVGRLAAQSISEEFEPTEVLELTRLFIFDDHGYNVKAYEPGGYFHWHDDFVIDRKSPRMIAMLFYLNHVGQGGYTEFINGRKVHPSIGRLVMFPATWNYIHRGVPPKKNKKYIISTYLYQ